MDIKTAKGFCVFNGDCPLIEECFFVRPIDTPETAILSYFGPKKDFQSLVSKAKITKAKNVKLNHTETQQLSVAKNYIPKSNGKLVDKRLQSLIQGFSRCGLHTTGAMGRGFRWCRDRELNLT